MEQNYTKLIEQLEKLGFTPHKHTHTHAGSSCLKHTGAMKRSKT